MIDLVNASADVLNSRCADAFVESITATPTNRGCWDIYQNGEYIGHVVYKDSELHHFTAYDTEENSSPQWLDLQAAANALVK